MANIAFDISQTGLKKAGCGYFAETLRRGLIESNNENQYLFLPNFGMSFYDCGLNKIQFPAGINFDYGPSFDEYKKVKDFWSSNNLEKNLGFPDIVHSNNFYCPDNLRISKLVYTLYDISFIDHPEWTTEENRNICFEGIFRASIYADYIVAISESSKYKFTKLFPFFPKDRISVVYPSARYENSDKIGKRPDSLGSIEAGKFLLNVGTIEPRKNQETLYEAYKLYASKVTEPLPLIFAGGSGWLMDEFLAKIKEGCHSDKIYFTGYVSDDELIWLYKNCRLNLYPSYYEGFGLPVLEALQLGAATICSNTTSLPEVGGDAVAYADPINVLQWSDIIISLSNNKNKIEILKAKAKSQAKKFTVGKSINNLLSIYQKVSPRNL